MQGKNLLLGLLTFIILLGGLSLAMADCTGCGDDGHQVCPIEKKHKHITIMKEEHAESSSDPMSGVVFAVCIFEVAEDGTRKLVDHVASENLMNCLKNKREAERKYKESKEKDGVYNMTCDKVDAIVKVQQDGTWEILEIVGRHEQAYERKKVYE
jgi:hypothetical protein|tara:strand:- start:1291 stop:1755 length:465 start_codon:yes stop_codon:yes gene_type:complete